MVERFHQILIWPLELVLPKQLQTQTVKQLANEIVDRSGGAGRPWRVMEDLLDRRTTEDRDLRYAEFVYFHPFIQRVLYPSLEDADPALAILYRDDVQDVEVILQNAEPAALTMTVKRIHLYLFRSQTALLVVEVSNQNELSIETAQQFADQFRRAYAPYHWKGQGGHCPKSVRWKLKNETGEAPPESTFRAPEAMYASVNDRRRPPVSAHWEWLLKPLLIGGQEGSKEIAVEQLEDDRIPQHDALRGAKSL